MSPTINIAPVASSPLSSTSTRRWFQFGLRTLLVIMLVASCLLAWVAYKRRQAADQQAAYKLIVAKGGATNFDPVSARSPWFRLILGEDISSEGGCIEFGDSEVDDADLAKLSSLRQLQRLSINNTRVTDKGLVHLRKLSHLKYLSLDETQISDDGLETLHAIHSLEWLSHSGTRTTPAGVESLRAALPYLNVIDAKENDWPPLDAKN